MRKITFENYLTMLGRLQAVMPMVVMVAAMSIALIEPAHAASLGGIENALQKFVDIMTGNVARLIGIIALVLIAFAWMFGFMDLRTAGQWVLGIVVVFSAAEIVDMVKG